MPSLQPIGLLPQQEHEQLTLEAHITLSFKHRTANRYVLLDKLVRANIDIEAQRTVKTLYCSEKSKKLLKALLKKIFDKGYAIINQKYMTLCTRCEGRQNINLLKEVGDIVTYQRITSLKRGKICHDYVVRLNPEIIGELKDLDLLDQEFLRKKISSTIHTNKNSFNKEYRSNAQARGANFSSNLNSNISTTSTEQVEIEKKVVSSRKKSILLNSRKKLTNSDRKVRLFKFRSKEQYDKPKQLKELDPINVKECLELQRRSGRCFDLNAQNEILKDMGRRMLNTFCSRAQFMEYFAKCLCYEKRNAVSINNSFFRITARMTEAEMIEHVTLQKREQYFSEIEISGYTHRTDESQYRAKLVGTMKPWQAYNFLSNLKNIHKVGTTLELHMAKHIELTPYSLEMILQEANAVGGYCGVNELNFCYI